jgi:hypothetical protein
MYEVIDRKTNKVMGIYDTVKKAVRRVNKLDLYYGACRYYYRKESLTQGILIPPYSRELE